MILLCITSLRKKNDNLFYAKPTFFNPKKETDQTLFKELDEKGTSQKRILKQRLNFLIQQFRPLLKMQKQGIKVIRLKNYPLKIGLFDTTKKLDKSVKSK